MINDPYLWLEDIYSPEALQWSQKQTARTIEALKLNPEFEFIHQNIQRLLLAGDRLPEPNLHGKWIYNFWQDEAHPRGLWRRTAQANYQSDSIEWETVLDLDELSRCEGENWVWQWAQVLPGGSDLCLVSLSRGGKDAAVIREFDLKKKSFVANGFFVPEAKTSVCWFDQNTILVCTDWGRGSLTQSGYPRIIKRWTRGTPLSLAEVVFEGKISDVLTYPMTFLRPEGSATFVVCRPSFFTGEFYWCEGGGKLRQVKIPEYCELVGYFKGQMLIIIREDWQLGANHYVGGSLLAVDLQDFANPKPTVIFAPTKSRIIEFVDVGCNQIFLSLLENVNGQIWSAQKNSRGEWETNRLELPDLGHAEMATYSHFSDHFYIRYEGFLTPPTIYYGCGQNTKIKAIKQAPAHFDSERFTAEQLWATSKDGTPIPYFLIRPQHLKLNGNSATILNGYGGFEIAKTPYYLGPVGKVWLAAEGVFVIANIRGGGEFGPRWHQSALRENRERAYEDFLAVAEDLITRRVTSPKHLGIIGRSNGGLLVGVAMTKQPDLFGAVVCGSPLLDMLRYTKLSAGPSWVAEYGDPDDPDFARIIGHYSPYQNIRAQEKYPSILFTTSTEDDRVHPGHARKMAAHMANLGNDLLFYENPEGGHKGVANPDQEAFEQALVFTFLRSRLMRK